MKKTSRLLSLALALLFESSLFLSCASDRNEGDTPSDTHEAAPGTEETVQKETETELAVDDLETVNLNGADYIIAGLSNRTTHAVTSSELNGEAINDAQYNAARTVEERFNVTISYEDIATDDSSMSTAIKGLVSGGEDKYAVTFGVDTQQISLSLSGQYYNLKNISQFNFDQPWWTDSTDTIGIGDKSYVASSYLSYYCLYYIRLLVMNKDIAAQFNIGVPYEQVFEGSWYLDDLIELASVATNDTNGDGTMNSEDMYGISYEVLYTLQNSMGITIISKDADNIPYLAFDIDRAGKYLEKVENLCDNYGYLDGGYGANFFAQNQSLFCYCNLREVCNIIRDTDINYGYLPAPKLDELQEDYMTVATDVYWGIPTTNIAKLDMIGTVTEALSCQHFNYVRPAFYETTMKNKLAGNENDMKVLDIIADHLSIDFAYAYQSNLGTIASFDDLYRDTVTSDTLASTYKKAEKSISKGLDKLIEKFADLP